MFANVKFLLSGGGINPSGAVLIIALLIKRSEKPYEYLGRTAVDASEIGARAALNMMTIFSDPTREGECRLMQGENPCPHSTNIAYTV